MPEIYELMGKPGNVDSFRLTEPEISPLHADLHADFPPTLIQVGDAEVMLSDSVDFGKKAQAAGASVEVQVYPRMWHCFHRFSEGCGTGVPLQEGIEAMKLQGAFLNQQLVAGGSSPGSAFSSLESEIQHHLNKDLVKGWEAHLRTVVGERRRPLQKAAKDARAASDRWHAGRQAEMAQEDYLAKINLLLRELQAANESDFDGLLKEALVCLQGSGALSADLPPLSEEETGALERIWKHRFGGVGQYKGRACDRDLRRAAQLRENTLQALRDFQSSGQFQARVVYSRAVDELRGELEKAGEVDFDGLLRQAVRVLEKGNVSKAMQKVACFHDDIDEAEAARTSQGSPAKSARRWRPKKPLTCCPAEKEAPSDKFMGA
jgi:hypothetical protein